MFSRVFNWLPNPAWVQIWLVYLILFLLLFSACCPSPVTEVVYKDRVISVTPPVIHDTLKTIVRDTVITGEKIKQITDSVSGLIRLDTVIRFKYYPRQQYADIEVKPDPVKIYLHDTVLVNHYEPADKKETFASLMEKFGLIAAGFAIGVLVSLLRK